MRLHNEGTVANQRGAARLDEQRSPRTSAWSSRAALGIAAGLALTGVAVVFGVTHSGQRPEQDHHPRRPVPYNTSSEGTAYSLDSAAALATPDGSSQPARPRAQAASSSSASASSSARRAPKAPKRERIRTAAGASAEPFPNLSLDAFKLPSDFARETDGPASDDRASSSPLLPAHDSAPSLNPGLPNNGTTSGSSPNPALMNIGSP